MKKPLIGVVLDNEVSGDYSIYPYYILRRHYFDALEKAGAIPVGIHHSEACIEDYVQMLDGLVMPGGDYDIPPLMYGDVVVHETVVTKPERLQFDWDLTQKFLDSDKPILGICAGEQLLSVILGGTLIQDIKSWSHSALEHYQEDRISPAHEIYIEEGTILKKILDSNVLRVNSHHHQAVDKITDKFIVSARSSDGIVEAIEVKGKKFCLGVQWHPEFLTTEEDVRIFKAFVEACQ